jgi:MinD superfamily P-loop ATPase
MEKERMRERHAELQVLRERVRNLEARFSSFERRIQERERGTIHLGFIAVVDSDRCVACGICLEFCPRGAISLSQFAIIDPSQCTGCGNCLECCPRGAITMFNAQGGTGQKKRTSL